MKVYVAYVGKQVSRCLKEELAWTTNKWLQVVSVNFWEVLEGIIGKNLSILGTGLPTNDTNYSCKIRLQNLFNQTYGFYIMPLVVTSLRGGHIDNHTYTHVVDKINFQKPCMHWLQHLV